MDHAREQANTQSTATYNGSDRLYGKSKRDDKFKDEDFTPLKDKLGASFFED